MCLGYVAAGSYLSLPFPIFTGNNCNCLSYLPLHNESILLEEAARGNPASFRELYEHYRARVYRLALYLLQSAEEAEDVTQDVFTAIWRQRARLAEINYFKSYLNIVTRNAVYTKLRKKAAEETYINAEIKVRSVHADLADPAEMRELQTLLHQAIDALPVRQKQVFQLGKIEGLKQEEIAIRLGISRETVKKHMMEATKNLRIFLSDRGTGAALLLLLLYSL